MLLEHLQHPSIFAGVALRIVIAAVLSPMAAGCSPSGSIGDQTAAPSSSSGLCAADENAPRSAHAAAIAANRFLDALSPEQRARAIQPFTLANAIQWSNFPSAIIPRAGSAYGELDARQTALANALVRAAAGTCGFEVFDGNRGADAIGHQVIDYINPGLHYISFNGTPSDDFPWMLMVGGHHLGFNLVFNGPNIGATPMLVGADPARYLGPDGRIREPLAFQTSSLAAVAEAVAEYPEAHFPGVFTDLTRSVVSFRDAMERIDRSKLPSSHPPLKQAGVPSVSAEAYWDFANRTKAAVEGGRVAGTDTAYPIAYPTGTSGRGVAYSTLPLHDQALVRTAIRSMATLAGNSAGGELFALYLQPAALAETFIGVSGNPSLTRPNDYARIDGPRVWIEISVQTSLIDPEAVHFHALWRDKLSDYGGQFRQ